MKRFPPLIPLLLALLGTACGGSASYTPADFTTEVYTPAYASGFDIRGTERNAATLVTVRTPWQGGSGVEQHLLVLREGIEPPAGFDGQIVKAPVRHVVCMSSSHVAMFDAIGQIRRVCGVSGIDYISNAYVNEHRCCGEVLDVGYDTNLNFGGIAERYRAVKTAVAGSAPAVRPKVMLNTPYRDTWFMPSSRSFMIRLIEDAGGEYVYTKNDSDTSVAVDLEEAYLLASSADVWLNVGPCNTLAELTAQNPKFAGIPAVRNRMVFNNNRRQTPAGGSDFWESGVIHPDLVLRDLSLILGGKPAEEGELHYYKRLE